MYKNDLIRKIWLISKIMTSQPGSAIHALPNISKRESDNEIWSANRIQHEKLFF